MPKNAVIYSEQFDAENLDWAFTSDRNKNLRSSTSSKIQSFQLEFQRHMSVKNIIKNIPQVTQIFDSPDYITLNNVTLEKQIEQNFVDKYLINPICDEAGYYKNDHDYLGLPILPQKTESNCAKNQDHDYSLTARPACFYFNSKHFCNICSRNCSSVFDFNNHMTVHTLKNNVTCTSCRQTFLTTTCLNNHLNEHVVLCEICGNDVPTRQLRAHQLVNKKQKLEVYEIIKYKVPKSKKIYFCVLCMKKFLVEEEYWKHYAIHKRSKKVR